MKKSFKNVALDFKRDPKGSVEGSFKDPQGLQNNLSGFPCGSQRIVWNEMFKWDSNGSAERSFEMGSLNSNGSFVGSFQMGSFSGISLVWGPFKTGSLNRSQVDRFQDLLMIFMNYLKRDRWF